MVLLPEPEGPEMTMGREAGVGGMVTVVERGRERRNLNLDSMWWVGGGRLQIGEVFCDSVWCNDFDVSTCYYCD
jgi:hypothetical protein